MEMPTAVSNGDADSSESFCLCCNIDILLEISEPTGQVEGFGASIVGSVLAALHSVFTKWHTHYVSSILPPIRRRPSVNTSLNSCSHPPNLATSLRPRNPLRYHGIREYLQQSQDLLT